MIRCDLCTWWDSQDGEKGLCRNEKTRNGNAKVRTLKYSACDYFTQRDYAGRARRILQK